MAIGYRLPYEKNEQRFLVALQLCSRNSWMGKGWSSGHLFRILASVVHFLMILVRAN